MPASIVLTGLSANDPVPNVYVEVNFAQGPSAGSSAQRNIVVLANKLSTGSGTLDTVIYGPDTLVPLQTETDMIALAGAGSEAHRLFRRMARVNKTTGIYWVFVTQSAGAAATGTVTITTTATANGNLRIWAGDEFVDTGITSGDSPTVIAAAAVINVNGRTHWPVTASSTAGVITLTAKQNGLRGNWIRFMAFITPGITTTTSAITDGFLTGGTTADSNATALATILPKYFYYVVSAAEDATQFGAVVTQVNTQAAPTVGLRQRAFAGSVDTLANGITVATGINAARAEVVWSEKNPWTPAELAANAAAIYATFETAPNPRTNFISFGNDAVTTNYWLVPKSRVDSAAPTRSSIKSALNNGLTPIAANTNGTTYLVSRITTRSLSGATTDYRIRAAHKVTICDFFADDFQAKATLQNAGKRIADDPAKGARPPGPSVCTPSIVRGQVFALLNDYDANDLIQNVADIKAGTIVQRETNPSTRMSVRIPLQPIDNLEQIAAALDQVAGFLAPAIGFAAAAAALLGSGILS